MAANGRVRQDGAQSATTEALRDDGAMTTAGVPVVLRGRVVTPDQVIEDGAVVIEGDRIVWVGATLGATAPAALATAIAATPQPWPGTTLLPGLVDLHAHGGGGASFPDATNTDDARRAAREHLTHGTTSLVASLVTADADTLVARPTLPTPGSSPGSTWRDRSFPRSGAVPRVPRTWWPATPIWCAGSRPPPAAT